VLIGAAFDRHPRTTQLGEPLCQARKCACLIGLRKQLALTAQRNSIWCFPTSIAAFNPSLSFLLTAAGAATPPCTLIRARLCSGSIDRSGLLRVFGRVASCFPTASLGPGGFELARPVPPFSVASGGNIQGGRTRRFMRYRSEVPRPESGRKSGREPRPAAEESRPAACFLRYTADSDRVGSAAAGAG
jgi:hypothetical protein